MILKMSVASSTTLKSQILQTLQNYYHHNQFANQFPQFPFSPTYRNPNLHLRPHPLKMSSQASPVPPTADSQTPNKIVKVVIKGRVQGVFYRNWTIDNATELGLKGWVRNRRDGSVEALFSGSTDKVGEMQERCRRGPQYAVVTGLYVSPCNEDPGTGFERRSTV